ncbi:MAG: response regulator [Spirochaetota bacterium]|nr:response regulator [Spirochaetota bacterium]
MRKNVILLVEDNENDEKLTLRALEKNEILHEVLVVRSGMEALSTLHKLDKDSKKDQGIMPELVLLDIGLPGMDGVEVLKRIKTDCRTQNLPVVVLTTSSEEKDMAACYKYGANSYIRKPIDFEDFIKKVGTIGKYWLEVNEPPPLGVA